MAWYDDLEGKTTRLLDHLEQREKNRRAELKEKRRQRSLYASPLRRMLALLVDAVLLFFLSQFVMSLLTTAFLPPIDLREMALYLQESWAGLHSGRYDLGMVWQEGWRQGYPQYLILSRLSELFLLGLAVVLSLWKWQCTPGMRLLGLRLRRKDRVGKPGLLQCLGFFLAGVCTLMIGYTTMIFTPQQRALHDVLSGTSVVRKKEIKEREATEALLAADAAAEAEILAEAEEKLRAREQSI